MRARNLVAFLSFALATSASAQGLMAEMHRDVNDVQRKFIDLAKAIPEAQYSWRPAAARSIGEVLLHVAADNYLIPIMMGKAAPASTNISATDFKTVEAYEKRKLTKDQIIADLEASFAHLHQAMGLTTDTNLAENMNFFGQTWSRQRAMLATVTHLHEHLGQMIAYARSNNITPPWSRSGG
ncbi:MAG TPA: DinB family protein [Gemmatimonadaceae bacterium]|nr:DinB family protein [Gemmatimonadaceae bacterium]